MAHLISLEERRIQNLFRKIGVPKRRGDQFRCAGLAVNKLMEAMELNAMGAQIPKLRLLFHLWILDRGRGDEEFATLQQWVKRNPRAYQKAYTAFAGAMMAKKLPVPLIRFTHHT